MPELTEHRKDQIEMHREVAEMYRRRAGYPFADDFQQERNDILLSMAPEGGGQRALDLGCGTGIMLNHLSRRFGRVTGMDISMEMLTGYDPAGADPGAVVNTARGDMTALPFRDASVDVILCRSALHHMDDEVAVLAEACRVLTDEGRLVVGEPANDNPLFKLARWWVRRRPSFGKTHTIDRAYTRAQLRDMFDRAGLEIDREHRFGFIAYTFCDNPDVVPVLKWLPAGLARGVGAALRAVDRLCSKLPLVRSLSWYTMLAVRRKRAA